MEGELHELVPKRPAFVESSTESRVPCVQPVRTNPKSADIMKKTEDCGGAPPSGTAWVTGGDFSSRTHGEERAVSGCGDGALGGIICIVIGLHGSTHGAGRQTVVRQGGGGFLGLGVARRVWGGGIGRFVVPHKT